MTHKRLFLPIMLLCFSSLFSIHCLSQDCLLFHENPACEFNQESSKFLKNYSKSNQTISFQFTPHKRQVLNLVLYKEKKHRIIVCSDNYFHPIHFKVYNKKNMNLIYDNSRDNFKMYLDIESDETIPIIIKVKATVKSTETKEYNEKSKCIGLLHYTK